MDLKGEQESGGRGPDRAGERGPAGRPAPADTAGAVADAPVGPAMAEALDLARRASRSAIPVLLLGETGTGKEWLARRIVAEGARARRPFLAVNCGALPAELAESLLFGHERGAFSGASRRQPGRFAEADGGTLFLDEVGELAPAVQAKLLRVLQEGEIDPLGARAPARVDCRIIAATNRDLEREVAAGRFRADLFYRLAVVPIRLPTLAERRGEIAALAAAMAQRAGARLTDAAVAWLGRRPWPGNIRELENAVRRAALLSDDAVLRAGLFGGPPEEGGARLAELAEADVPPLAMPSPPPAGTPAPSLAEQERQAISRAVSRPGGTLSGAARDLGIGRTTLYRKMRRYGLATRR